MKKKIFTTEARRHGGKQIGSVSPCLRGENLFFSFRSVVFSS